MLPVANLIQHFYLLPNQCTTLSFSLEMRKKVWWLKKLVLLSLKKWQGRLLKLISYIFGSNDWQDQHHHQPWRSLVPWWSITADGFTPLMKRVIKHGRVWGQQRSAERSKFSTSCLSNWSCRFGTRGIALCGHGEVKHLINSLIEV